MGLLLGYMANRADRLQQVLKREREALLDPESPPPAGWGIGFYQGGEVLHKKRPMTENEALDWDNIASDIRSDCAILHLRRATVGDFRSDNMHPFRMRSWLFAHLGTVAAFDAIRPRLLESMPDFLRRNIRGETDSEHVFHMILSFLHDSGNLDHPEAPDREVLNAIRSTMRLVDRLCAEVGAPEGGLNMVLTNGRRMFAARRGAPMRYAVRHHNPEVSGGEERPSRSPASALRYVVIASSDGSNPPAPYEEELESGSALVVDRDLQVQVHHSL